MGMFDSLYAPNGDEYQTKAYDCLLDRYSIGDMMPELDCRADDLDYQVETLGDSGDAFATILEGRLHRIGNTRDPDLPLFDYRGWPA